MPPTALIPIPAQLTSRSGAFVLTAATQLTAPDILRSQAELLRDQLRPATGLPLAIAASARGGNDGALRGHCSRQWRS